MKLAKNFSFNAFERVTDNNFDSALYLLANQDVKRAGVDPLEHFNTFGRHENRSQISAHLLRSSPYRMEKFDRFKHIFEPGIEANSFPINISTCSNLFDINDYDAESANADFDEFIKYCDSFDGVHLDVGSGFRPVVRSNILYLEVYPSITSDVMVGAEERYAIKSNSVDTIGCFAVLEHVRKPWRLVSEFNRILKPGGRVYIDWPFLQPLHGFPSHYFNASQEGLRSLFLDNDFEIIYLKSLGFQTPDHTLCWIIQEMINSIQIEEIRDQFMSMRVSDIAQLSPGDETWKKLLSAFDERGLHKLACGNTLVATKK